MPLMFFGLVPSLGYELYRTEGTPATTRLVREICVGRCDGVVSTIRPVAVGSTLYFVGSDPASGQELWRSDGTPTGTRMVADIVSGSGSSFPGSLTRVGNLVYFVTTIGQNYNIWRSDGTAGGTRVVVSFPSGSGVGQLTPVGNRLAFVTAFAGVSSLWITDGTAAGTQVARQFADPNNDQISNLIDLNGTLYFTYRDTSGSNPLGRQLWRSDVTAAGTQIVRQISPQISSELVVTNNRIWFVQGQGADLWSSEGTADTTTLVRRLGTAGRTLTRVNLAASTAGLLVSLLEGSSIGSFATAFTLDLSGTQIQTTTRTSASQFYSTTFMQSAFGSRIYFNTGKEFELYATDIASTAVVGMYNVNYTVSYGASFLATPDAVYYPALTNNSQGVNLYRVAWPGGTPQLVSDLNTEPGHSNSNPLGMTWVDGQPSSLGRVSGDFNGDGRSDILWRNFNDGYVTMWQMDGTSIVAANYVYQVPLTYRIAGTGDFDGDGKTDILWRAPNGDVAMWLMDGATIKQAAIVANAPLDYVVRGVGDFNGDGRADILWQNSNGDVTGWLMNGTSFAGLGTVGYATSFYTFVGIGDFNGDGRSDVMWRGADGSISTWQMNGLSAAGYYVATVGPDWQIQGLRDMDGDLRADVVWRNDNGSVALWRMDGNLATPVGLGPIDADETAQALGDFDGDRRGEILWRSSLGTLRRWDVSSGVPVASEFNTVPLEWEVQ